VRFAILCGNGRFPLLALQAARDLGAEVVAIGIEQEASREIEQLARTHWISLGALSRLIEILKRESITELMFCGQVKHASIFSAIQPDWRLAKVLWSLREKNTDSLIGAVVKVLEEEGIHLRDSTELLKPLMAVEGRMTKRGLSPAEQRDVEYGRRVAAVLAEVDIGQSVAIADRACVAAEAMEGTDAMLRRAASLVQGKPLTLVKVSRRRRHLLFDVPVVGLGTIAVMRECGATALAIDAGRTLMLDRPVLIAEAESAGVAIHGFLPDD
jgi:DUF1009 family protein